MCAKLFLELQISLTHNFATALSSETAVLRRRIDVNAGK
jgi:hypothetical protein